jgi:3',5'-cyclic AMP phosphodiesterase CpdA
VRELGRTAPVHVIPGNHDVQWWRRPLVPFARAAKYEKYATYFGPVLTPSIETSEAVVAGMLTSHGLSWGSLGLDLREWTIRGHLPRSETRRVKEIFSKADETKTRIAVMHHNLIPGERSGRNGLVRCAGAQKRVLDTGADIVLCGHDHHDHVDLLHGVTVVTTGTISSQVRYKRPPGFHRVAFDNKAITVELYRWEATRRIYHRSDVYAFARRRVIDESRIGSAAR